MWKLMRRFTELSSGASQRLRPLAEELQARGLPVRITCRGALILSNWILA